MIEKTACAVIILAAGKGTRMKTDLPKVLNTLGGKPMIHCVVDTAQRINADRIIIIVGYRSEEVITEFKNKKITFVRQKEQLGTAHAVQQAHSVLKDFWGDIIVLSGDVPLLQTSSLLRLLNTHKESKSKVSIMTSTVNNPSGYGRIIRSDKGTILAIKEDKDIEGAEKEINEINAGIYCFDKQFLYEHLSEIENKNVQGEFYLPDIIGIAVREKVPICSVLNMNSQEVRGINTKEELELAEKILSDSFRNEDQVLL